ncbi:MAG: hypothetical protein JJT89_18210 [Nitriliruptoraceae bacterium]|nr:hypothetical protein [Nitriliruptoraceae bacterium]
MVLPGTVQPVPTVGVVLDTSASMSRRQLTAALTELEALCRRSGLAAEDRVVATADVVVHEVGHLRRAVDLPLVGGGGTDLRPALHHVATHRRRPDLVVVLTPWPSHAPPTAGVLVVLIARTDGQRPPSPPRWAEVVRIEPG